MIYIVLTSLFIAQALYMRVLFESFRRKVYFDMMDFLIKRQTKEIKVSINNNLKPKHSCLKLIRND